MAAADILNADMATVGRALRDGFDWWTAELTAMLPARARRGLAGAPPAVAELSADGTTHRLWRGGAVAATGAGGPAAVALPAARALERALTLPAVSWRDTRALVALDLDRLTPLSAEGIVWDIAPAPGDAPPGRRAVLLGVVPRAAAEAALRDARGQGVEPLALGVAAGAGALRYDFLPQLAGPSPRWADRRWWWGAAGALLALNLAIAIQRDVAATGTLTEAVAAQGDGVALARRLQARVTAEEARRRALALRRDAREPGRVLAAATRAVPPPAWVRRFAWDGRTLRLSGYERGVDVVTAARRAPAFTGVRAVAGDLATPEAGEGTPFDLALTPRP